MKQAWFAVRLVTGRSRLASTCALGVFIAASGSGQMMAPFVADGDIGGPPKAPAITLLGIVAPGKLVTDPSLPPKGNVAEVVYEELRAQTTTGGPAGEVVTRIQMRYDARVRVVEESRRQFESEVNTVSRYEGARIVSQESTRPGSKANAKFWNYWEYDSAGKLTDFRRGSGDEIQNHVMNLKRDRQGRLISFEYRQGSKDSLETRTEFHYSADGKTVESSDFNGNGEVFRSVTRTIDEQGHVALLVIRERDWRTKKAKIPVSVSFRYDGKGRVVEQSSDSQEPMGAGSENDLPPGKITVSYDDEKHTKTTVYSSGEGRLESTLTLDSSGATIGMSGGTEGQSLAFKIDCAFDAHENWTSCKLMGKVGGDSVAQKMWRRTITYR